ncbi:restriction endonuclease subunit S [Campylobacter lanienae]|uniref:restriction endonuclease subunit S n=1 Tax=Campylobacter lanienae TaxID=75658 RepID=UPI000BB43772|nr:restriction endonuclease subunit S [Campylobacter lanienae]
MSKLEELINKLCPNGVEFKTLGELGKFYGGLTGKSKEDFNKGNAKFITYKNVYENLSLKIDVEDRVNIGENEKQRTLEYGDIIFTGSSETSDECGISSVLTQKTEEKLYLNSFCFFLRLNDKNLLNPDFTKHLFRSSNLRYQIGKTASGVTRFNVSKKAMEKVCIPVPPLEVQCEIVRILDNFTLLSAELSAELSARQKQYEYYKNLLLKSYDGEDNTCLKDIAEYSKDKINANELNEDNYIGVDNLLQNKQGKVKSSYIPKKGNSTKYQEKDILIGNIRPYLKKIWLADNVGGTNGDVLVIRITGNNVIPEYLYFVLSSDKFFNYNNINSKGAKMPRGDKEAVMNYKFYLPLKEEQLKIIDKLNKFKMICNDISEGLPAEIEARKKQYEYYRDKLLTFKELK